MRSEAKTLALELFDYLRRLTDDLGTRTAAATEATPVDRERDLKLVDQIVRTLERLEALLAAIPDRLANSTDEHTANEPARRSKRAFEDEALRADLERRFHELRTAGSHPELFEEPDRAGA